MWLISFKKLYILILREKIYTMTFIYPETYTDEDKAIYDDMISRGQALIGKKLKKQDEFLLDLSAKITINQMKGIY